MRAASVTNIAERNLVRGPQNVTGGTIVSISTPPPKGSLSSLEARQWYLKQLADIPNRINKNLPLEQQARQAFSLRNRYKIEARKAMSDRRIAEALNRTDPVLTWRKTMQKYETNGLSGESLYKAIIESSQRSKGSVNASLGL